jgi:threonine synthase
MAAPFSRSRCFTVEANESKMNDVEMVETVGRRHLQCLYAESATPVIQTKLTSGDAVDVITVSEGEIWQGLRKLARTGLYVEPTSAVVSGALDRLHAAGELRGRTVAILSGTGLKATEKIVKALKEEEQLPKR